MYLFCSIFDHVILFESFSSLFEDNWKNNKLLDQLIIRLTIVSEIFFPTLKFLKVGGMGENSDFGKICHLF